MSPVVSSYFVSRSVRWLVLDGRGCFGPAGCRAQAAVPAAVTCDGKFVLGWFGGSYVVCLPGVVASFMPFSALLS